MKLSTSLILVASLLAALCASACTADTKPEDESEQNSELTDAERAKAKGDDLTSGSGEHGSGAVTTSTDLTTGSSTCATCGPLPDPWTHKAGPLPDPWKSTSAGGGGTGTSSTGTGSGH